MFETTKLDHDSVLHVAENLQEQDRHEINAGRGDDGDWEELAEYCMRNATFGCVAKRDEEPVAVFYVVPLGEGVWQAHRYATDRWPAVSFSLAKVIKSEFLPGLRAAGAERVQCAMIDGNTDAHSWIEWCVFDREEDLPGAGMDGQMFILFAKVWGPKCA